jgi:hypothetical protein
MNLKHNQLKERRRAVYFAIVLITRAGMLDD